MKKKMLFIILLLQITYSIFGQHSIKYFSKDWKEATKENYYFVRKIDSLDNGIYFVTDSLKNGKMFKTGYYKSLNPEIEHGKFYFKYYKTIYRGQYSNGEMSGLWYVYNKRGKIIETLDYDFQLINIDSEEIIDIEEIENSSDSTGHYVFFPNFEIAKFGKEPDDFKKYVADNLHYPPRAAMYGIMGEVKVLFTIDTTGQVINIRLDSVDKDIDKEAIRVIHNSPLWNPGKQEGKLVRNQFIMPLNFILDD